MNPKLWIMGAGGHARVVAEAAFLSGKYSDVFFLDDKLTVGTCVFQNYSVKGQISELESLSGLDDHFICGVGNKELRLEWFKKFSDCRTPAVIVHPFTFISIEAEIGEGSVVLPGSVIQSGAKVGKNCIINASCLIDHDVIVGDNSHIERAGVISAHSVVSEGTTTQIGQCFATFSQITE